MLFVYCFDYYCHYILITISGLSYILSATLPLPRWCQVYPRSIRQASFPLVVCRRCHLEEGGIHDLRFLKVLACFPKPCRIKLRRSTNRKTARSKQGRRASAGQGLVICLCIRVYVCMSVFSTTPSKKPS